MVGSRHLADDIGQSDLRRVEEMIASHEEVLDLLTLESCAAEALQNLWLEIVKPLVARPPQTW